MIPIQQITGRLGNQMFQFAFMYAYAMDTKTDFYFQDTLFFKGYEEDIKKMYRAGIKDRIDMVAIHVRRGDYVNNPFYVDLMRTEYYRLAMDEFSDVDFLVFSDDIKWCKEQDIFKGCQFYHKDELDDFNTMASCIGHIIANSSYSWWSAYIAPWSKKIIAPKEWYADGDETRTILPDNFIRI